MHVTMVFWMTPCFKTTASLRFRRMARTYLAWTQYCMDLGEFQRAGIPSLATMIHFSALAFLLPSPRELGECPLSVSSISTETRVKDLMACFPTNLGYTAGLELRKSSQP